MIGIRFLVCCGVQICLVFLLIISLFVYVVVEYILDYFVEMWIFIDGLLYNSINSIVQICDGYLWFVIWEGVV